MQKQYKKGGYKLYKINFYIDSKLTKTTDTNDENPENNIIFQLNKLGTVDTGKGFLLIDPNFEFKLTTIKIQGEITTVNVHLSGKIPQKIIQFLQ